MQAYNMKFNNNKKRFGRRVSNFIQGLTRTTSFPEEAQ